MVAIRRSLVGVLLGALLALAAPAEEVSRAKINKAGKAATALVAMKTHGVQGSAFCVHPAGFFLTNEHLVRVEGPLTLTLNPGGKAEKTLQVKVLRSDATLDLALLQVEGEKDLPVLPLVAANTLSETDEVIAFGFPFGTHLATGDKESPAISVNVGKVTSLREKDGELHRIQFDAVLNPGNSGGPVLDKEGKVAGVVVSGVRGAGVNFAIPIGHVHRFLARPEIFFDPPAVSLAAAHAPAPFQAQVLAFTRPAKPLDLELVLKPADGPVRSLEMKLADGVYRATAVPFPPAKEPARFRLTASYPRGGLIQGETHDHAFKVGGTPVKLADVRRILAGPEPRVWVRGGKVLRGELTGAGAVPVLLGAAKVPLDLSKAVEARFRPPAALQDLAATVVVRSDGKEVARLTRPVKVQGVVADGGPELFLDVEPPALEKDVVERKVDGRIADVAVGGGGRYLILHLPSRGGLAVFDVNQAKVVKLVPAAEEAVKFAAGLDKLVVLSPGARTVQRWDLNTMKQDLTGSIPGREEILTVSLGSASNGPVVLLCRDNFSRITPFLLDLESLTRQEIAWAPNHENVHPLHGQNMHARASADGSSVAIWCTSHDPNGMTLIHLNGAVGRRSYNHYSAGHLVPGLGGKALFTGMGVYKSVGTFNPHNAFYPGTEPGVRYVPAHHGEYCLCLGKAPSYLNRNPPRACAIHETGVAKPLLRPAVEFFKEDDPRSQSDFSLDKRFHLIPDAKVLIVIPPDNDRLILHRIDLEEVKARAGGEKK